MPAKSTSITLVEIAGAIGTTLPPALDANWLIIKWRGAEPAADELLVESR
jgi:hypothetical protein